jgi:hypothetical protein
MNAPLVPTRQTHPLAVISLVAGLLGWSLLPFMGSIGAIICGHMARARIRREPDRYDGDLVAIIGLVLGWLSVAVTVIGILIAVLFFGGIAAFLAWLGLSGQLG